MNHDLLLQTLQSDLLANILEYAADIKKCSEHITLQIREMIGARVVALLATGQDGGYHLLAACPKRKREIFNDNETRRLVAHAGGFKKATLIVPGQGEAGMILSSLGIKESFVVPLRVGDESFGMLFLLDLMDTQGIQRILDALRDISGLLSLVFKQSFLYHNMESLVAERTEALWESELRSLDILQTAMDGFLCIDVLGCIIDVNNSYCRMSGYSRNELLKMTVAQLAVKLSQEEIAERIKSILSGRSVRFETTHQRKDGSLMTLEISSQLRSGSNGKEIFSFLRDITERKRSEAALRESEEKFQIVANHIYDWEYWRAEDGSLVFVSPSCERITGYRAEEFSEDPGLLTRIIHPDDRLNFLQHADNLAQGAAKEDCQTLDFRIIRRNGEERRIEHICREVFGRDGDSLGHRVSNRDITERKLAEREKEIMQAQLIQAQKMEAIGTLAGGIAHDFNNILGAILGYAEMAREDCPPGSVIAGDLDQVVLAGKRAKDLVKQILAFSRQAETERVPVQPAVMVKEAVRLLRSSLPTTIVIQQDIDPDCNLINADPTQIHQILMNLCTNAYHAMEETGGVLTISLKNKVFSRPESDPSVLPGTFVHLSVGDTGQGILPEIRERIFDPYFTTKEVGKGTGMGLAIVHGIVQRYGGFIDCRSVIGEGTVFDVNLPVMAEGSFPEDVTDPIVPAGRESILFVDDEEILAEMAQRMLTRMGYTVTVRTTSLETLATFENQPDAFDLVITDQTMPGMTGLDLARRMLQIRPDLPIILCTGYSSQVSEEKAVSYGIKGFAMKPLAKKDIAALIRKILGERKSKESRLPDGMFKS